MQEVTVLYFAAARERAADFAWEPFVERVAGEVAGG